MKKQTSYYLTDKERDVIREFLDTWRNKEFKGGRVIINFHDYEPQEIRYEQSKKLGGA